MTVRHRRRDAHNLEPQWPLALILAAAAVSTVLLTGTAEAVPFVVGPVVLGLRLDKVANKSH